MPEDGCASTILADVCEALVGAVFLDGGYPSAEALIERFWKDRMLKPLRPLRDPKTILQEWAQARGLPTPAYKELARTGPHHSPKFRIAVELPDRPAAEEWALETRGRTGRRRADADRGRHRAGQGRCLRRPLRKIHAAASSL